MAKAFDKMNKHALFIKLMNNNCPMTLINILDCWYDKSFASVKWGDTFVKFVGFSNIALRYSFAYLCVCHCMRAVSSSIDIFGMRIVIAQGT